MLSGAVFAVAYAGDFANATASAVWAGVPIQGSTFYEQNQNSRAPWHFDFHRKPGLVELQTGDRVREYVTAFYDSFIVNPAGINPAERDKIALHYTGARRHDSCSQSVEDL